MFQRLFGGVRVVNAPSIANIQRLDMGVLPIVAKMQAQGLLIDRGYFVEFSKYLASEEDRITERVKDLSGHYINVGSADQVEDLLFKKMRLKPPPHLKKTGSGKRYSMDEEALTGMKGLHPVVPLIQEFGECNKMRTSFSDVLPKLAGSDGRIRTSLATTRQVSGRISSKDPNLMAQPVRSDLGIRIRKGFIAPHGRKLGCIDLSQIQMRIAAHEAGCESMIDTFLRDGDIHSETASRIFKLPVEKLDKMRHRYPAKRIGFGILFGMTEEGLQDQITVANDPSWTEQERAEFMAEWTLAECARIITLWFNIYPEIRAYMSEQHARARRYGCVWDMFGRIRWIPEAKSASRKIVEAGLRQAGNTPIQSAEAGIVKLIMTEIDSVLLEGAFKGVVSPLIPVHDEVLFEGDDGSLEDFLDEAGNIAGKSIRLLVPIKYNCAIGDRWGDLEH